MAKGARNKMKKNVLIVSVCKEKLHELEFVKPIEDILNNNGIKFMIKNYKEIDLDELKKFTHIIICGTSLMDNSYLGNYHFFDWIKDYNGKILGICAGMQIIGLVFGHEKLNKWEYSKKYSRKSPKHKFYENLEIGLKKELFEKEFLGIIGEKNVYFLHNYSVIFEKDFIKYTKSGINNGNHNVVKHSEKEIYGVLFHPEVRNKDLIVRFVKL